MTDILESIRRLFVPIHKEGYPFIAIAAVVATSTRPPDGSTHLARGLPSIPML